jgi:hypothetical protein
LGARLERRRHRELERRHRQRANAARY